MSKHRSTAMDQKQQATPNRKSSILVIREWSYEYCIIKKNQCVDAWCRRLARMIRTRKRIINGYMFCCRWWWLSYVQKHTSKSIFSPVVLCLPIQPRAGKIISLSLKLKYTLIYCLTLLTFRLSYCTRFLPSTGR